MSDSTSNFVCPITHEIMTDPVADPDGNNYERTAIETWLGEAPRSPITYAPLTVNDLHSNEALRTNIEQHQRSQSLTDETAQTDSKIDDNQESFDLNVTTSWLNDFVHISIKPDQSVGIRAPCDICCVIDTSGSMSCNVTVQGAHDNEAAGLTQLDIAIHALKTIIHSLTENDRLAIVSFSDNASILFKLTQMNEDGRSKALTEIEKLDSNGCTNLWDGLKTGLDVLTEGQRTSASNVALFLLTDGCPSEEPAGGHLPALTDYKTTNPFTCSINTFGFGYSLDSKLLQDLAQMGNSGTYAFIPDGSFVGTIFVNSISNLLTTVATNIKLAVGGVQPPMDSSSIYIENYSTEISTHKFCDEFGLCINLGCLQFGQSKDVVIPMSIEQYKTLEIIVDYESAFGQKKKQCKTIKKIDADAKLLNEHKHRLEFINFIHKRGTTSIDNDPTIKDDLQLLETTIKNDATDDKYLTDLLSDLTGQVSQALSREDWFKKWGIHYLPSIALAHLLQQCNNFKDPGVQHYGEGELFNTVRDEMDSIFCALPAPVRRNFYGDIDSSPTANVNMSAFNDPDGPCFHGSCLVKLFDGSIKFVKDIQRGDRLYPHGATVNYVLKTICKNKQANMVLLDSGLIITAWHPIRLNDLQWIFPCSLVPSPTKIICEELFSFALDKEHTIWINDIECITLGHGFKQDILRHNYYGTQRVIEDLRILDEQQNCTGIIQIQPTWIHRNKQTALVNAIRQPNNT